ncbi:MAG: hypothetical protein AVDCRST_MAG49-3724, partial [uncultured Thermomicrobiales bacterium]
GGPRQDPMRRTEGTHGLSGKPRPPDRPGLGDRAGASSPAGSSRRGHRV